MKIYSPTSVLLFEMKQRLQKKIKGTCVENDDDDDGGGNDDVNVDDNLSRGCHQVQSQIYWFRFKGKKKLDKGKKGGKAKEKQGKLSKQSLKLRFWMKWNLLKMMKLILENVLKRPNDQLEDTFFLLCSRFCFDEFSK